MNLGISCFNIFTRPNVPIKITFGNSQSSNPNDLIEQNMGLVNKVLRGLLRKLCIPVSPQDREELRCDGFLALCEAANEFDTSSEQSFEEFAKDRIYKAIVDNMRQNRPKYRTKGLYAEIGKKGSEFYLLDTIPDNKATRPGEDSSEKLVKMPELPDEIKNAILARYGTQIETEQTPNYLSIASGLNYNQSQFDEESREKLFEIFTAAIEKLPPKQKEIIVRRFLNGESTKDIADKMQFTKQRFYGRCFRAINKLKLILYGKTAVPKITPDMISYIFEDEERKKNFLRIFETTLPSKQRQYFELRYGIKRTPDGEYQYTKSGMKYSEIAKKYNVIGPTVYRLVMLSENRLRTDSDFIKLMADYKKLLSSELKITPDVMRYIFEDEERSKKFLKILDNLPPRRRQFFELRYGIIKNTNGEYECTGKAKTHRQIAKIVDCSFQNIHQKVTFVENQLKKDKSFVEIIEGYEEK